MTERERIHAIVEEIGKPLMLQGSAVMTLHGMPRAPDDIDVFVSTQHWFELYHSGNWTLFCCDPDDENERCDPPLLRQKIHGVKVDVFFAWRIRGVCDIDVNDEWRKSEVVDGIRCCTLVSILEWKDSVLRGKDKADAEMIRAHLGRDRTP